MSEENTTQAPGLVLPDDAAAAERVTATDRLLSFDAAGNPVTATASQLREYAAAGLATTKAMTAALAEKQNTTTDPGAGYDLNNLHTTGTYNVNNAQNSPVTGWIYVDVIKFTAGAGWVSQFVYTLGANNTANRMFHRNGINTSEWSPWVELWHTGNFNPDICLQSKGMRADISQEMIGTGFQYDTGGSGTTGPFLSAGSTQYALQIVCGYWAGSGGYHNLKFRTRNGDTGVWNPWYNVYCDGNLGPATAASAGLMSAADKIKLNSVASAMSLTVQAADTPATLSLTDEAIPETVVTPEISVRAQRAAQYQMQADELLYDALEAFARNHPEHSEFAAWLEAKDRIRQELPKPQEGGTNE